jgi:phospholipid/cholesterol/gamma-HCH transport system substrate-binding protein
MERDANYFFVGIFVSLAILALVWLTIWVMGAGEFTRYQRYTVFFTDPISGLVEKALVKYKGVEVGRVLGLRLDALRADIVKVDIDIKEGTPINRGTIAVIEPQGITGSSYLELETRSGDQAAPLREAGEQYPVLQGKGSDLRAFLDDLPGLAMRMEGALGAVEQFAQRGAKVTDSIDEFATEGARTANSIRALADSVRSGFGTLKGSLETSLSSIDHFSKEGAKTADSIRGLSDNLNGQIGSLKGDLETTLSSIEQFSKEGAQTADAIRGLADKLKDDPSQILRPAQQRGVVIPK